LFHVFSFFCPWISQGSKSARNSMKSRASRLARRTSDTLPLPGARAVCRFTHPKSVDFCGLELMACQCQAEPLAGRDRSALLVLLEQAAKSVEAARQMKGRDVFFTGRSGKSCTSGYTFFLGGMTISNLTCKPNLRNYWKCSWSDVSFRMYTVYTMYDIFGVSTLPAFCDSSSSDTLSCRL
jgi:hypothetical protein